MDAPNAKQQSKYLATLERLLAIEATAVKPALDQVSDSITAAVGAEKVDAFIYESATHTLVALGTSNTPMARQELALGLHRLPIVNGGRAVQVFETGQVYHCGHADSDTEELRGIREGLGIRSVLAVPVEIDGVRRGVLQVDSSRPMAFTDEDRTFLIAVANWVGMVMHRAELVERLTREAKEQTRRVVAEELVTIVAHDLRNYLTPLMSRVYTLRARAEREGRARDVAETEALAHSIHRLERLLSDLLDVARIEQGLFGVTRQPVNLAALAREAAAAMQTSEFLVQVRAPDSLIAAVDANRLRQALDNLLANARRHAPGSPVMLEVRHEAGNGNDRVVISIEDRGPGIAPEALPRLTERYVGGNGTNGLGIGLYLARSIADAHGGTLEVESTLNVGSTFRFILPLTTTDHANESAFPATRIGFSAMPASAEERSLR
jgi:two-component system, OmpR family, sensor kinase